MHEDSKFKLILILQKVVSLDGMNCHRPSTKQVTIRRMILISCHVVDGLSIGLVPSQITVDLTIGFLVHVFAIYFYRRLAKDSLQSVSVRQFSDILCTIATHDLHVVCLLY